MNKTILSAVGLAVALAFSLPMAANAQTSTTTAPAATTTTAPAADATKAPVKKVVHKKVSKKKHKKPVKKAAPKKADAKKTTM